jgi:hypothetical protein
MILKIQTIIILTLVAFTALYLVQPVPYCRDLPTGDRITEEPDTIYSEQKVSEINQEILEGPIAISTVGGSMIPSILPGQKCVCIQKEQYKMGDIVAFFFREDGTYQGILHRIVSLEDGVVVTKGDANPLEDPPFPEESIFCAVPEVKRWETFL